jgi:hypothetical protein
MTFDNKLGDHSDRIALCLQSIMNLDYLLTHAEEIADFFKRCIDLNDGLIDGPVIFNDQVSI